MAKTNTKTATKSPTDISEKESAAYDKIAKECVEYMVDSACMDPYLITEDMNFSKDILKLKVNPDILSFHICKNMITTKSVKQIKQLSKSLSEDLNMIIGDMNRDNANDNNDW